MTAFDMAWGVVKTVKIFKADWVSEVKCVKCGDLTDEVVQCTVCFDNWCPGCYEAFSPQWFHIDGDNLAENVAYRDNVDACPKHGPDFRGVG